MDSVTISALLPWDTQLRIKLFIACVKHPIAMYEWMVYRGCVWMNRAAGLQ